MSLTLPELCEKLKDLDEISLLELLDITSEDLVSRFVDVVEDRYEDLLPEFGID